LVINDDGEEGIASSEEGEMDEEEEDSSGQFLYFLMQKLKRVFFA